MRRKNWVFWSLVACVFTTVPAFAQGIDSIEDAEALRIVGVKVTEEIPTSMEIYGFGFMSPEDMVLSAGASDSVLDDIIGGISWDKVVLIGEKLINIIKAGSPVVNIKRDAVFAVPSGLSDWQVLSGWQFPVTKVFRVQMHNALGMNMVDVRIKVSAMYGGSLKDKGKYLANVIIVPTAIIAQWGVTLDVWSENREPVNIGSADSPVAGLGFDIRYRAKTWISDVSGSQDYFITGNGEVNEMH